MKRIVYRSLGVWLWCAATAVTACAQPLYTLVDATLARTEIERAGIRDGTFVALTPQGPLELPLRDVLMLERYSGQVFNDSRLQLVLRDGQIFSGTPGALADDKLMWTHHLLGGRGFALARVARIKRANSPEVRISPEEATSDVLLLSNGDRTSGIIASIDEQAVTLQTPDARSIQVDWAGIQQIYFAQAGESTSPKYDWRVSLEDGSIVDVKSLRFMAEGVMLGWGSAEFPVNAGAIRFIENRASRARLLTDLPPSTREYAPYFPRSDRDELFPVPRELVVGNTRTRTLIAMRPYSRITWTLEGAPKRFKTRYIVADRGALANVHIRVWLDDRNVLDQAGLTSQTPFGTFETPIVNEKTLTLEVDFGENFDVQDQLYWIEPALIWDDPK